MSVEIGNKYGSWIIISDVFLNKWNKKSVNCQCVCGTIRMVDVGKLNDLTECKNCYHSSIKVSDEDRKDYKANWFQENRKRLREKRRKNPIPFHVSKNYQLKYLYNITSEEVEAFFLVQKGRCYICNKPFFGDDKVRMVIDHNHETNKVRSLLCHNCNIGLGCFKENINTLKEAIKYLDYEKVGNNRANHEHFSNSRCR
jgi:hypothetical protein